MQESKLEIQNHGEEWIERSGNKPVIYFLRDEGVSKERVEVLKGRSGLGTSKINIGVGT